MRYNSNIHHRRSIRLKGYDYSQKGLYFVTICVDNRQHVFGKVVDGKMILNEYGEIAYNEWAKTSEIRPNVQIGAFVVMPNHIHGIIAITDQCRGVLHTPLHEFATTANRLDVCNTPINADDRRGVCNTPLRSPSQTIGAIVRGYKSAVTKQLNALGFVEPIWFIQKKFVSLQSK